MKPDWGEDLDRYIDDVMPGDERARFEARIAGESVLARRLEHELDLERRIDRGLRRAFAPPDALARSSLGATPDKSAGVRRSWWLAAAAAILVGLFLVWWSTKPDHRRSLAPDGRTWGQAYASAVEHRSAPSISACTSIEDLARVCTQRYGSPLRLPAGPVLAATTILDEPAFAPWTALLINSEPRPILVLIGPRGALPDPVFDPADGLIVRRREIGPLSVLEITPFPEARLLPHFSLSSNDR